jgi:hypothetical protein
VLPPTDAPFSQHLGSLRVNDRIWSVSIAQSELIEAYNQPRAFCAIILPATLVSTDRSRLLLLPQWQ